MYESQFEEDLYNLRREKLRQIAALGQATYPDSYAVEAPGCGRDRWSTHSFPKECLRLASRTRFWRAA